MGISRHDIFGTTPAAQPALPGSYGVAPTSFRLPDELRLGPVRLQVSDLARSEEWYAQVLGLSTLSRESSSVSLGVEGATEPLVVLEHRPATRPVQPGSRLGLYHFAILLPDRASLGRFVRHLSAVGARAGASDHLVSEALYLQDPDGLGIEVYRDRPRNEWQRSGRELMMATDPLDFDGVVNAAGDQPWTGMPIGTVMGHLHLHVGDLGQGAEFYAEALGLDRMVSRYPGALFLGAGGYHHHLGINTWARGAVSPGDNEARLLEWQIVTPGAKAALASLEAAGFSVRGALATDPWGTMVRLLETGQS